MRNTLLLILLTFYVFSNAQYVAYRNVKSYGAKGDGVTDDTSAITAALTQGRSFNPSTTTPATVYFPAGTYRVTQPLPLVYYTEVVGDFNNMPTIKFDNPTSSDIRVFEAEGSWYHDAPQNNFFHSIRNLIIDMTSCKRCTGVHWQVAQATSLTNMVFKMGRGTQNQGIWMENGSGGFISDLIFEGGIYGLWIGNQQFTSRNISVSDASMAAVYLNWDWGWTWQGLYVSNCPVGIDLGQGTGSVTVVDSVFANTPIAIRTQFVNKAGENPEVLPGVNTVVIDNVNINSASVVIQNNGNNALRVNGPSTISSYVQGHVWDNNGNTIKQEQRDAPTRPSVLVPYGGRFMTSQRPNFVNTVDVSTLGVVGDGKTDVTAALQKALLSNANGRALLFPHGLYMISDTVYVPPGSRLVGQAWSAFVASGNSNFQNVNNPKPMLQVGKPGERGVAQLVGLLMTTQGPQPGAKLIEWNMHDPVNAPASCGMWDVHYRVGGAIGTNINPGNCPSGDGSNAPASSCTGTWALLHLTPTSSCYIENSWGWTADHDIDQHSQINVYNGRGLLCESQGPVWLYGTAMEHSLYYQYNFYSARNVMMGMLQTETPYFQPSSKTPFSPNDHRDPQFCTNDHRCNMAYAMTIYNSTNIFNYGAGFYSFFNVWSQACLQTSGGPTCQVDIVKVRDSKHIYMYALSTYGSVNMLTSEEQYSKASHNGNTFCSTMAVDLNNF